jgi:deoxyribose-phosphate aldolase
VRAFREACGAAHLKAILATGELRRWTNVARASWVAMMAGADFIKTSTGKEGTSTPRWPVSLVMVRAIRDYAAEPPAKSSATSRPAASRTAKAGHAVPGADEGGARPTAGCSPTSSASAPAAC